MFYPAHIFNKTNIILYKIYKRNIYVVWNLYISDVQCFMLYAHALIINNYHYMNSMNEFKYYNSSIFMVMHIENENV